jgi:hypothetical protein
MRVLLAYRLVAPDELVKPQRVTMMAQEHV